MISRRLLNLRKMSSFAAVGAMSLLSACSAALIEAPFYDVSEVQSFKVAGAPSQIMMLEIVDQDDTFPDETWITALSNHGYAPRLTYVTDATDIADNQTIKPENRLVVVVSPTQSTMRDGLCTDPQSTGTDTTADRVIVRFGFCSGDDIISGTRARFVQADFEQQLRNSADTISYQLFPMHLRKNNDRYCSPMIAVC
ncbi:MAG: hypothetical protein RIG26_12655 [Thalassospira sp.]|uniref:hypothetical protein n=1 Tax=Thalassospira sp. TaxID=1912094 RepID=UPI0032EC244A